MEIIQITDSFDEVFTLIRRTFDICDRQDCTGDGADYFVSQFLSEGSTYRNKIEAGEETVMGAFEGGRLVGVITVSAHGNISCAFVDPEYQGRGIGKALFARAKEYLDEYFIGPYRIRLNSSPFAVRFYESLGFEKTGCADNFHGIISTPMAMDVALPIGKYSLREFHAADAEDLYKILSDEETMRYIEAPFTMELTKDFLSEQIRNRRIFALTEGDALVGQIIFHPYGEDAYELGWILDRSRWNQGIATLVTRALIDYSRGKGIARLVIECHPDQEVTKHIAKQCGFAGDGKAGGLDVYSLTL